MITVIDPGGSQGITVVDPGVPHFGMAPTNYDPSAGGGTLSFGPFDTGIKTPQGVDRFLAGAGKAFSDVGLGAKQLFGMADASDADAAKKRDAALMSTGAGTAGNIFAQIAQSALIPVGGAASGLGRIGLSALAGGAQAGIQPVGTGDSRVGNTALGAALGGAGQTVANGIGSVIRPTVAGSPARQAAMDWADQNGATMTAGDISGSPWTKRLETVLSNMPGSRGFYQRANESKNDAITKAVNDITQGDAGQMIQNAGAGKTFTVDQPMIDQLQSIGKNYASVADRDAPNSALKTIEQYVGSQVPNPALNGFNPSMKAQAIAKGVPEFITAGNAKFAVGDTMPMVGQYGDFNNYQALRSLYGKRAHGLGDDADKTAYGAIQDALDSAAARADPSGAISDAQKAYAAQKTIESAAQHDNNGNLVGYSPAKLANLVSSKDAKGSMLDNLGDAGASLRDIANFAKTIQPANSSGTAENSIAGKVATLEILKDLFDQGPGTIAKAGFGLVGAPWLVNAALQGTRNGVPFLKDAPMSLQMLLRQAAAFPALGMAGVQSATGQ